MYVDCSYVLKKCLKFYFTNGILKGVFQNKKYIGIGIGRYSSNIGIQI